LGERADGFRHDEHDGTKLTMQEGSKIIVLIVASWPS
jgi:hypothetical protein